MGRWLRAGGGLDGPVAGAPCPTKNNAPMVRIEFDLPMRRAQKLHQKARSLGMGTRYLVAEIVDVWLTRKEE